MRKTLETITIILVYLVILDIVILFASMGQIAAEGRTGHWPAFWRVQAEFVVNILAR